MTVAGAGIWSLNRRVTHRLMAWSGAGIATGLVALWAGTGFWRSFGAQCIGWGVVDGAIALGGQLAAERQQGAAGPAVETAQTRQLRRLFWFNAGLDVLYIAGGVALSRASGKEDSARHGHGAGIVFQGEFLFIFDLVHALHVPWFHRS